MKYSFLQPLSQDNHSAHKLGSLKEEKVQGVISAIMSKLRWDLVDIFECGLLRNNVNEYLATSLDGWLVIRCIKDGHVELLHLSENEDDDYIPLDKRNCNCGFDIKTPSTKKLIKGYIRHCMGSMVYSHNVNVDLLYIGNLCTSQNIVYKPFVMLLSQT